MSPAPQLVFKRYPTPILKKSSPLNPNPTRINPIIPEPPSPSFSNLSSPSPSPSPTLTIEDLLSATFSETRSYFSLDTFPPAFSQRVQAYVLPTINIVPPSPTAAPTNHPPSPSAPPPANVRGDLTREWITSDYEDELPPPPTTSSPLGHGVPDRGNNTLIRHMKRVHPVEYPEDIPSSSSRSNATPYVYEHYETPGLGKRSGKARNMGRCGSLDTEIDSLKGREKPVLRDRASSAPPKMSSGSFTPDPSSNLGSNSISPISFINLSTQRGRAIGTSTSSRDQPVTPSGTTTIVNILDTSSPPATLGLASDISHVVSSNVSHDVHVPPSIPRPSTGGNLGTNPSQADDRTKDELIESLLAENESLRSTLDEWFSENQRLKRKWDKLNEHAYYMVCGIENQDIESPILSLCAVHPAPSPTGVYGPYDGPGEYRKPLYELADAVGSLYPTNMESLDGDVGVREMFSRALQLFMAQYHGEIDIPFKDININWIKLFTPPDTLWLFVHTANEVLSLHLREVMGLMRDACEGGIKAVVLGLMLDKIGDRELIRRRREEVRWRVWSVRQRMIFEGNGRVLMDSTSTGTGSSHEEVNDDDFLGNEEEEDDDVVF
ncbi:hypothetical protein I302_105925 [Kwoniella bestiolae CBS 10118]|uniref:Uncharacterized protein n=1 Tax=Kwoniella bestiolae CBS 10118 TaxID=1296100 RepID=A0AAJ8M8Q0_9TREE